jgi:cell division protein FtsA
VLTGGGSLLRHLPQLVKFRSGLDVRIGYPGEHLASETLEEINQPMYSTSIGLLLKGDEIIHSKKDGEMEINEDASENEEPKYVKSRQRAGIFDSIKKTITDIFEENDARM